MRTPFSPERLANIRRLRKARRLFKKEPLFAFNHLTHEFPDYTFEQFLDDLRIRKKSKKKTIPKRLERYGRYNKVKELLDRYQQTNDIRFAIQAKQIMDQLRKPYRLQIVLNKKISEYCFHPYTPYSAVEQLSNQLKSCTTQEQIKKLVADFSKYCHI